jgi:hypothetical protein
MISEISNLPLNNNDQNNNNNELKKLIKNIFPLVKNEIKDEILSNNNFNENDQVNETLYWNEI